MSMTQKDYELIAHQVKIYLDDCDDDYDEATIKDFARSLAIGLSYDNPTKFSRTKFLRACGIESK